MRNIRHHKSGPRSAAVLIGAIAASAMALAAPAAAKTSHCLIINDALNASYNSLQAAQDAASPADTLWVRGSCVGTTTISKDLTITGQQPTGYTSPTLDGAGQGVVLTIEQGVTATVNTLTISHGKNRDIGGGILYRGTLTLNKSTVSDNTASIGGGVGGDGTLTVNDSTISGNTADVAGGIFNVGEATVNGSSSIADNAVDGDAGGINNYEGTLTLNDSSTVTGNTADYGGGGIRNDAGTVTLNDSSAITANSAGDNGGGIWNGGAVTLNDSSAITRNTAGDHGGGVFNTPDYGTLTLTGGTVSGNTPDDIYP